MARFLFEFDWHIVMTVDVVGLPAVIERLSFECRKGIGFASTTLHDWLKKLAPIFHPIRSKIKTNRDSLALVFPALCVSYM